MDSRTLEHYEREAARRFTQYIGAAGGISELLLASFPASVTVLDVGAGNGLDIDQLLELGFDAWGVEPANTL